MQRSRNPRTIRILSFGPVLFCLTATITAQAPKSNPNAGTGSAPTIEQAMVLAEQGHCVEAIPALKRGLTSQTPSDTRKNAEVLGLRCSLTLDNRDSAVEFIRLLNKQFAKDPDVLFILVHAYSDLSTRTAQDLGRTSPESIPAHKLLAEAFEMQGKWDEALHEYEKMIEREPNAPGLHYLEGRSMLSRPDADAKTAERAKEAFQKEVEIDPKNAGAHYVLGELAAKEEKWEEAIGQFSTAATLDPNFAEAYLGWGFALVTVQRYQEAIAPLRAAERLMPRNASIHYALATALSRTGQKEEAEKEFAIHRELVASKPAPPGAEKP